MNNKIQKPLYRVRFMNKEDNKVVEVTVKRVVSSEFLGLIMLEDFVFSDSQVVLAGDDKLKKQFLDTKRLHIPYHNILAIEEFLAPKQETKQVPFIREISSPDTL